MSLRPAPFTRPLDGETVTLPDSGDTVEVFPLPVGAVEDLLDRLVDQLPKIQEASAQGKNPTEIAAGMAMSLATDLIPIALQCEKSAGENFKKNRTLSDGVVLVDKILEKAFPKGIASFLELSKDALDRRGIVLNFGGMTTETTEDTSSTETKSEPEVGARIPTETSSTTSDASETNSPTS
ncbi:MAG: hypothetical protein CMQ40_10710 [Gammaproteobacteria bacterium]|nr:hypothetical protein [Gammaproteobacteria bacterium]